jgi:phosphoglycolate phosphatase-like HAD superfamily hydrolase
MYAVGALWGFRNADELQDGGAQALVETPQDLLFILA